MRRISPETQPHLVSYGLRGLDAIRTFIRREYVNTTRLTFDRTQPLSVAEFVSRVLVPEIGLSLIAADRWLDRSNAIVELEDSRPYGMAVNGGDD